MSESHANRPADFAVRQQALDTTASFAVAAPAGSGKTGLLTLRLLKLLCQVARPEDIVCITFTRKAAAEMRERLLDALANAHTPLAEDATEHALLTQQLALQVLARDSECQWQLQSAPGRLRIQTIDSFCRSLATQLPVASALGAELATLDDPTQAYRLAVEQLLKGYSSGNGDYRHLDVLIRHLDNQLDRLEDLLVGLLARRDQWISLIFSLKYGGREQFEAGLRSWAVELVEKVHADLAPFASELLDMVRYATQHLARENPTHELLALQELIHLPGDSDAEITQLWHPLISMLLTNDHGWRKQLNKNNGFPPGNAKEEKAQAQMRKQQFLNLLSELQCLPCLHDNLQELRHFPGSTYSDEQWTLLSALTQVLPLLVAELKLIFRQLNATDFVEITEAALAALGNSDEPSDLALKLDYQIHHILVDEFQDTSTPQLTLLQKLTEGWQAGDGRTLFVVGDGMQSCYGFRDANVGIFLDIRSHGLPSVKPQALDLSVNFRSRAGIVAWVNSVFAGAFPALDDIGRGAVRYSTSGSSDTRPATTCVTCVGFTEQEDHQSEARYIADQIAQLRAQAPAQSIAVLVRGRAHLQEIVPALVRAAIPYRAVDIDPLLSRMAIVDLLSLTRALLDPSDRIAWLSVLRAPWCGLSMDDLHALVTADLGALNTAPRDRGFSEIFQQIAHFEAVPGLSAAGIAALSRLRTHLMMSWENRRRKPLRQWVEGTWLALGGPTTTPNQSDREDAHTFFNLLEKHDQAGTINNWREFEDALARLYAQPANEQDNPVELMTIHKSKGLEFDHVFLPGLDRRTRHDDPPLILWHQRLTARGEKQLVVSPITAADEENTAPLYQFLAREHKVKNRLEDTRLLYVACTRAKQTLWLTANLQLDKDGAPKAPTDNCLLARIWPHMESQLLRIDPAPTAVDAVSPRADVSRIQRLTPDWAPPPPAFTAPLAEWRGPEYDNTLLTAADQPFKNRIARHTGTLWHRLLRQLALDGLAQWDIARIRRQRPFWRIQAQQLGLDQAATEQFIDTVEQVLGELTSDATARWVFDNSHQDSQCEYVLISEQARQKLIVDRTFIDKDRRWIIDFKTSEPGAGQTMADFLAQERSNYKTQLEAYASAFALMEDLPQSLALYFPQLRHLEVL